MRILYTNFHGRNGGGHVTYIINLAKALAGSHQITVATPETSRLYRYAKAIPGVTAFILRGRFSVMCATPSSTSMMTSSLMRRPP